MSFCRRRYALVVVLASLVAMAMACRGDEYDHLLTTTEGAIPSDDGLFRLPPVEPEDFGLVQRIAVGQDNADETTDDTAPAVPRGLSLASGASMPDASPLKYSTVWFPSQAVKGQQANLGLVGQDLSLMCPLHVGPGGMWMALASVRNRIISTDAIMPTTGQLYPDQLWNVSVGTMVHRQLDNGYTLGGGITLGSASDRPFASIREMNVNMNTMLRVPQGERNAWMFALMYSPMGELNFPIPGVAFLWNPSEEFQASLGLPFRMVYRPTESWLFEATYMPIHAIHIKALRRFGSQFSAFAGYDWSSEVYSLVSRVETNDRFFMYDQRATLGVEVLVAAHAAASATAGYAFDRFSYEGRQWNGRQINRVNIDPGPFAALQLMFRY